MTKAKRWAVFAVCAGLLVALDLLLKNWSAANLQGQPDRVLVPGFLGLTYLENPGAAFGLLGGFQHGRPILIVVSSLLMLGVMWYFHILPGERRFWFLRVPLIMIFAGGVGNLYDRVALGAVRDMLEFLFVRFPIFNLADVFITTGAVGFFAVSLFLVKDIPFFHAEA